LGHIPKLNDKPLKFRGFCITGRYVQISG
jgi:hypothetical protein